MAGQRWVSKIIVLAVLLLIVALVLPFIQMTREVARRSTSKNNLKQIGIALDSYHETFGCLPPGGTIRDDGKAMHGWLTMLLPFLSQDPHYNWIDFNKSWDNPVNQYAVGRSFPMYLIAGIEDDLTSTGFAIIYDQGNPNLFYRNSSVTYEQMENGTAHTWMLGEVAGNYQPWGYPFNWRSLGTKLCNGPQSYGRPTGFGGHFVFADGSVSFLSDETSPELLRQLANAPPIATKEQMAVPEKRFKSVAVGLQWEWVALQSDPESRTSYDARVLKNQKQQPLKVHLYLKADPKEKGKMHKVKGYPTPYFLVSIDSNTDIPQALKATSLSNETTPEQFQVNVKTLQALQKKLQ